MRIAIFSDVHGNPYACEAVLERIYSTDGVDKIIVAGDLCLGGSDPGKCIDLLQEAGVEAVYGNTEEYIKYPYQTPKDASHSRKWGKLQPAVIWVRLKLSRQQLDWINSLPFELTISPTSNPSDDLLIVHANPLDIELMIYPNLIEQQKLFGKIIQPDDDPALVNALKGLQANILAFGHFHYPSQRKWRDKTLVNVASCSLPGVDFDPTAHYTIFTFLKGEWLIEQYAVDYDVSKELEALKASDMPSKDFFLGYFGNQDI